MENKIQLMEIKKIFQYCLILNQNKFIKKELNNYKKQTKNYYNQCIKCNQKLTVQNQLKNKILIHNN